MPYIKQREKSPVKMFLSSGWGEALTAAILGGAFRTVVALSFVRICVFVSDTLYPFTYPFLRTPLHSWLPDTVLESSLIYEIAFSAVFAVLIYYFEKNIFYRRFHILLKTSFAALAACVFVFTLGLLSPFIPVPEVYATELPSLFIYHYLTLLPLFLFSDAVRRRIFVLP